MANIKCAHCKGTHGSASAVYICAVIVGDTTPGKAQLVEQAIYSAQHAVCDCGSELAQGDHRRCWQIGYDS